MSFASTLDEYCVAVNCTSKKLAALCGVSPSTVSRYRNGERTPEAGAAIIGDLADGLAKLSHEADSRMPLEADAVRNALESGITDQAMIGMNFNMRFDSLMQLAGIRNAKMAEATQVDPSYISRIRKGTRMPADTDAFVEPASRLIAQFCLDKNLVPELGELIGEVNVEDAERNRGFDANSNLAEPIASWLLGDEIVEADAKELGKLFQWLDTTDFSEWLAIGDGQPEGELEEPVAPANTARFYYGVNGMQNAEIDFLTTALDTHSRKLAFSSDMPLLQMELDRTFVTKYRNSIANLLRTGCHISVVHSVERPLYETIRATRMWTPFYMTGRVTPYYLKGIHNRLFCHVNYVSDSCALASEAMIGHQEDGRYFFTTRPADVAYYQKKMGFILEKSSMLFEVYRDDVPEQHEAFAKAEAQRQKEKGGRTIGEGRYERLSVRSYAANCTVLTLRCEPTTVHFVIRHPKINYATTHMK